MKYFILSVMMLNIMYLQPGWAETAAVNATDLNNVHLVKRHLFTSNVKDHEPVDSLLALANSEAEVYFYTDLRHLDGQRIVHRWQRGEQILAEVAFNLDSAVDLGEPLINSKFRVIASVAWQSNGPFIIGRYNGLLHRIK